ncbi:hypothetical protein G6L37_06795 [Agrobacterium rubi]|nr:hypothetical protein [Agrobacterium rubi]NTF25072.1 hypothetical protein [Agrobacterium rubi]
MMDKKTLSRLDEALKSATKAARILSAEGFDTADGVHDAIDALREAGARMRRKAVPSVRNNEQRRKSA